MSIYLKAAIGIFGSIFIYSAARFFFDFLLRGFAPFISSRPWVVKELFGELAKLKIKEKPRIYSLGCGRSGFLYEAGKRFPGAELIGVEHDLIAYLLAKLQLLLRRTDIKLIYQRRLYELDISRADLVYCYLEIEQLRDLPKKFRFECEPGTIVFSNGYPIPNLSGERTIELPSKKRKLGFLARRKKFFRSKDKEGKRANLVYFYYI
jgi:hypothetical protein